jgi:hypothetical protein
MSDIDLFQLMEDRRIESQQRSDVLHKRIGELRDELTQKIDESHRDIMREIKELRKEQNDHAKEMSKRVGALERWRWVIVGGATAVGFIFAVVTQFFSKLM